jgi:hypothetical protein
LVDAARLGLERAHRARLAAEARLAEAEAADRRAAELRAERALEDRIAHRRTQG